MPIDSDFWLLGKGIVVAAGARRIGEAGVCTRPADSAQAHKNLGRTSRHRQGHLFPLYLTHFSLQSRHFSNK